jgi:hypothetical protein
MAVICALSGNVHIKLSHKVFEKGSFFVTLMHVSQQQNPTEHLSPAVLKL